MNKNYCPECGKKLEGESNFCSNCGYQLNEEIPRRSISQNNMLRGQGIGDLILHKWVVYSMSGLVSILLIVAVFAGGLGIYESILNEVFGYGYYGYSPGFGFIFLMLFITLMISLFSYFVGMMIIQIININVALKLSNKDRISVSELFTYKEGDFFEACKRFIGAHALFSLHIFIIQFIVSLIIMLALINIWGISSFKLLRNYTILITSIPVLYFSGRYIFFGFFIFNKGNDIVESLKSSYFLTDGNGFKMVLYQYMFVIMIALSCLVFVGPIFTIPAVYIILTKLYKRFHEEHYVLSSIEEE